jgi:hypothetical protein
MLGLRVGSDVVSASKELAWPPGGERYPPCCLPRAERGVERHSVKVTGQLSHHSDITRSQLPGITEEEVTH